MTTTFNILLYFSGVKRYHNMTVLQLFYCFISQVWKDNMSKVTDPDIRGNNKDDYTKITFVPDLTKFKMTRLDEDIVALMTRRAYDAAASTKDVKVRYIFFFFLIGFLR